MAEKKREVGVVLPALILAGLGVIAVCGMSGCGGGEGPEVPEKAIPTVAVEILKPVEMSDRLAVQARIEPWTKITLSAEAAGTLVFAAKEQGSAVTKGERLFGVDRSGPEARVRGTKAGAEYAETARTRLKSLLDKGAIARDEYDRLVAELASAKAAAAMAEADLAGTNTLSPIDGILDTKMAEVGEFVGPGTPLGTIVDISRIKVVAHVPEKDIRRVSVGDELAVDIDALRSEGITGNVVYIKQEADPRTLTFPVHVALDNKDGRIRPGMIARVHLVREAFDSALAVPAFSIVRREDGYHVFVEENGIARRCDVELGVFDGHRVQVIEGLDAGDRLIVRGQRSLLDGDEVSVAAADVK